jgi:hypothetical protein
MQKELQDAADRGYLANREILQHVFGDVTKRQLAIEFRASLPR